MDNISGMLEQDRFMDALRITPVEERYYRDGNPSGDEVIRDKNLLIQSGSPDHFNTLDKFLTMSGFGDIIIEAVGEDELHYYDDYPKVVFFGQGHFAKVQFNV